MQNLEHRTVTSQLQCCAQMNQDPVAGPASAPEGSPSRSCSSARPPAHTGSWMLLTALHQVRFCRSESEPTECQAVAICARLGLPHS